MKNSKALLGISLFGLALVLFWMIFTKSEVATAQDAGKYIQGFQYTGIEGKAETLYSIDFAGMTTMQIVGGAENIFHVSKVPVVVNTQGSLYNSVEGGENSNILGGNNIKIENSDNVTVIGGRGNNEYIGAEPDIFPGNNNVTFFGGMKNLVKPNGLSDAVPSVLLGGIGNSVHDDHNANVMVGGKNNAVEDGSKNVNILGGEGISVGGTNVIAGGKEIGGRVDDAFVFNTKDDAVDLGEVDLEGAFFLNVENGVGFGASSEENQGLTSNGAINLGGNLDIETVSCMSDANNIGLQGSWGGCLVGCTERSAEKGVWELLDHGAFCAERCDTTEKCVQPEVEENEVEQYTSFCTEGLVYTDHATICNSTGVNAYENVVFETYLIDSDDSCDNHNGYNQCVYQCNTGFHLTGDVTGKKDGVTMCFRDCPLPWNPAEMKKHNETVFGYSIPEAYCATDTDGEYDTCSPYKQTLMCVDGDWYMTNNEGKADIRNVLYNYGSCDLKEYECNREIYNLTQEEIKVKMKDRPKLGEGQWDTDNDRQVQEGRRGRYKTCIDYESIGIPASQPSNQSPWNEQCGEKSPREVYYHYKFIECQDGFTLMDGICMQDCSVPGKTFKHGESVVLYADDDVTCPDVCRAEKFVCNDGTLEWAGGGDGEGHPGDDGVWGDFLAVVANPVVGEIGEGEETPTAETYNKLSCALHEQACIGYNVSWTVWNQYHLLGSVYSSPCNIYLPNGIFMCEQKETKFDLVNCDSTHHTENNLYCIDNVRHISCGEPPLHGSWEVDYRVETWSGTWNAGEWTRTTECQRKCDDNYTLVGELCLQDCAQPGCGTVHHNETLRCYREAEPVCPTECSSEVRRCLDGHWYNGLVKQDFTSGFDSADCKTKASGECKEVDFPLRSNNVTNALSYNNCTFYTIGSNPRTCITNNRYSIQSCKQGFYKNGDSECRRCPTGYTSNEGATKQEDCYIDVPAKQYLATAGTTTIKNCPVGEWKQQHKVQYGDSDSCNSCTNFKPDHSEYSSNAATNSCSWTCDEGFYDNGANSCNPIIHGSCGTTHYNCIKGTTIDKVETDPAQYTWTCQGDHGTSANCFECKSGYHKNGNTCYKDAACGDADGKIRTTAPSSTNDLCSVGTKSAGVNLGNTTYTWKCSNNGGPEASCSATRQYLCGLGKYLPANSTSCTSCPAGYYCPGGTFDYSSSAQGIASCVAGTYSTAGMGTCIDCKKSTTTVEGTFSASVNSSSCTSAGSGYYTQVAKATARTQCPAGYYCPSGKKIQCPSEYPNSNVGSTKESDCYAIVNGSCGTTHYDCTAGTSSNNSSSDPSKYTWTCQGDHGTNASCFECKSGYHKNGDTCYQDAACGTANGGTYTSVPSSNLCSVGTKSTGVDSHDATYTWTCSNYGGPVATCNATRQYVCSEGTYLPSNATSCTSCPAGYYCPGGTFNYSLSVQGRNSCEAGTYSNAGVGACTQCAKSTTTVEGTYSNSSNSSSCTPAGNGYYTQVVKATGKTICPAGYYCPSGKIVQCPTGKTSDEGAMQVSDCYTIVNGSCGATHYSCNGGTAVDTSDSEASRYTWTCQGDHGTSANCFECKSGYHENGGVCYQNAVCGSANGGTRTSAPSGAVLCSVGTKSAGVNSNTGTYTWTCSNYGNDASCSATRKYACSEGKYLPANSMSCTTCTAGYYCQGGTFYYSSSIQGRTGCVAGTYSSAGVGACTDCLMSTDSVGGTYSTSANSNSCTPAGDGYYTQVAKATAKTQCPAGYYCPGGKLIQCPDGKTSGAGSTQESDCYTVVNGSCGDTHYNCNGGTATNTSSSDTTKYTWTCQGDHGTSTNCFECKSGYHKNGNTCYQDAACGTANGQTHTSVPSNNLCSVGTKSAGVNSNNTTYTWTCSNNGNDAPCSATRKYACGEGTYLPANGTSCTDCTAGYYCPGGTFSYKSSIQGRKSCVAGTYSNAGAGACTDCLKSTDSVGGTYSSSANSSSCTPAGNGYYTETSKATGKTICPAGYYCPSGKIVQCPDGKTSAEGATKEADCYNIVNGKCGNAHYICTLGTSSNNSSSDPSKYTWICKGDHGTDASCFECKSGYHKNGNDCEPDAVTCTGPCGTVEDGETLTCYDSTPVQCPKECASETRKCIGGQRYKQQKTQGGGGIGVVVGGDEGWEPGEFEKSYPAVKCNFEQKTCSSADYPLTSQNVSNAASYNTCEGYTVSSNTCNGPNYRYSLKTCNAGFYKNGNSCTQCPSGYPNSAVGSTKEGDCYKTVTVTYNTNGATSIGKTSDSCPIHKGETSCTRVAPSITRNNWDILGWSTSASATNASVTVGGTITLTSNATYYAITKQTCAAGKYSRSGGYACQNCAAGKYKASSETKYNTNTSSCSNCPSGQTSLAGADHCYKSCTFNGGQYNENDTVSGYISTGVTCTSPGSSCSLQTFTCHADGDRYRGSAKHTPYTTCRTVNQYPDYNIPNQCPLEGSCYNKLGYVASSDGTSCSSSQVRMYKLYACNSSSMHVNDSQTLCCYNQNCYATTIGAGYSCSSCATTTHPYYAGDGCYVPFDPGCFISGTKVTMADGTKKNIEDVKVGDKLLGNNSVNTVLKLYRPLLRNQGLISINGSKNFVTPSHPFMTTEGWKSLDPDESMKMMDEEVTLLELGDTLITENGYKVVESLVGMSSSPDIQLYNFKVDGDNTYYADGYLVHNKAYSAPYCTHTNPFNPGGVDEEIDLNPKWP